MKLLTSQSPIFCRGLTHDPVTMLATVEEELPCCGLEHGGLVAQYLAPYRGGQTLQPPDIDSIALTASSF
jgi:hypothetical protein